MKLFLLKGKHCPCRGIKVRELTYAQRMKIFETAAAEASEDTPMAMIRVKERLAGVCSFLVGVTEKAGFKTSEGLKAADVKWRPLTVEDLTENLEKHFSSKEVSLLVSLYADMHETSKEELDAILGEGLDVTED